MQTVPVSLIVILICVAMLIYFGMKGVNPILTGTVAAALVSFCVPDGFVTSFFTTFPERFGFMCQGFFFLFVVGGCFGGVLDATGSAESIGKGFVRAFGTTNWYWPLIIANMLLAATGAVPWVLMSYISFGLAKRANCPRYVCLVAVAGTMVISQQVLPGATTLNNLLTSQALGVDIYSGSVVGIITAICGVVLIGIYINKLIKDARAKGIGYDGTGNEDSKLRPDDELPNFWLSLIPLLVLLGFVFVFVFIFKQNGTQGVVYGTVISSVLLYLFNHRYIKPGVNVLKEMSKQIVIVMPGMVGACVMYGFASIVAQTPAISGLANALSNSSFNPYIIMWLGTMLMVAIMANGSSGALSFIGVFKEKMEAMGVNMAAAQRLINITSASWDTLPHNSFVNAMIPVYGYDIKTGYKYLLISNCVLPTVYSLIALVLTLFIH
ncbi:MAG: GntP family permease [Blautia sp.]|nr:GntP family permease [Blautia sp.]